MYDYYSISFAIISCIAFVSEITLVPLSFDRKRLVGNRTEAKQKQASADLRAVNVDYASAPRTATKR